MEQIRAFIAVELPDEVKASLTQILKQIRPGNERLIKWVNPDSIHLTLKFLGNIPADSVNDIDQVVGEAASGTKAFSLSLGEPGAFPNFRSPRVVWVGVEGDVSCIMSLQRRIEEGLIALGFPPEKRKFSPHLTVGRVRDKASSRDLANLGERVKSFKVEDRVAFTVDKVCLMKSTLTNAGAIYDRLASRPLDRG